jgi:hypothetical protein
MMARLKASSAWKKMAKVEAGGIRFKPKAVAEYKRKVKQLLEQLLILIHITGGQPARGTEMTILRYLNAQQNMRNVYIQDGRVIVVTRYHKAQVSTGQLRVIPTLDLGQNSAQVLGARATRRAVRAKRGETTGQVLGVKFWGTLDPTDDSTQAQSRESYRIYRIGQGEKNALFRIQFRRLDLAGSGSEVLSGFGAG